MNNIDTIQITDGVYNGLQSLRLTHEKHIEHNNDYNIESLINLYSIGWEILKEALEEQGIELP